MSPIPPTGSDNCEQIYSVIGSGVFGLLFLISEGLPFIKSIKSNGLTDTLINFLKSRKKTGEVCDHQRQDEDETSNMYEPINV